MTRFNQLLLFLHFLGLTMGFSASFAGMVMGRLMASATPTENAVLARFPPLMGRVGSAGLALLWASGGTLVYTKWGGVGMLPWQFRAKLGTVVLLTGAVAYIHRLQRLSSRGDHRASAQVETLGKVAMALAVTIVLLSVLTFD